MKRHPLIAFVVLAYALTWVLTIPFAYCFQVILEGEFALWLLLFFPAPFGPTIAALIMARVLEGRDGVRRLLSRLRIWRASWGTWMVALCLPALVVAGAVVVSGASSTVFSRFSAGGLLMVPVIWLMALPFGPLAEELGWRGWLLPRLQGRMGSLQASLLIGVLWTFWHIPMFWFPGAAIPSFLELSPNAVLIYLAQIVGTSILFTALFNRSGGSVLIAIVLHTAFNTAEATLFQLVASPTEAQEPSIYFWTVGLTWVAAGISLVVPGWNKRVVDVLPEGEAFGRP